MEAAEPGAAASSKRPISIAAVEEPGAELMASRPSEPAALEALLQGERRLRGRVKSWSDATGFGFVACPEVAGHFDADVFLHRNEVEAAELSPGLEVSFVLRLRRDGKPQAKDVVVEDCSENPASRMGPVAIGKAMWDRTYMGTVKHVNQEKGFGFIACDETHRTFGRDVFVLPSKLCGLPVGEAVRFRISVDPVKGAPRCRDLEPATSGFAAVLNGFAALKFLGQQPKAAKPIGGGAERQESAAPTALNLSDVPLRGASGAEEEDLWAALDDEAPPLHRCDGSGDGECADAVSDSSTLQPSDAASLEVSVSEAASPGLQDRLDAPDLAPEAPAVASRDRAELPESCLRGGGGGEGEAEAVAAAGAAPEAGRAEGAEERSSEQGLGDGLLGADAEPAVAAAPQPPAEGPEALGGEEAEAEAGAAAAPDGEAPDARLGGHDGGHDGAGTGVGVGSRHPPSEPEPPPAGAGGLRPGEEGPEEASRGAAAEAAASAGAGPEAGLEGRAVPAAVGDFVWQRYLNEEGATWWWRKADGDWFLETSPGPWAKYADPSSGRAFWWKSDDAWFWI